MDTNNNSSPNRVTLSLQIKSIGDKSATNATEKDADTTEKSSQKTSQKTTEKTT